MDPVLLLLILTSLLTLAGAVGWRLGSGFLPSHAHILDRLALTALIGLTIYHGFPLIAGQMTGRMTPTWMAVMVGFCLLVLMVPHRYLPAAARPGRPTTRSSGFAVLRLLAPPLILAFALGVSASRWPARVFDAVTYHMVNPMVWFNTGQWDLSAFGPADWDPSESQASTFPNPKAITPWLALHIQPDGRGTSLAQWPFLFLLIPTVVALAWRMRIRGWALGCLPLLVLLMPEVALQSQESYADLVLMSAMMATFWAGCLLVMEPPSRKWKPPSMLHGVPLGLGCAWILAAKPTGLLLAPLALVLVIGLTLLRGHRSPIRLWLPGTLIAFGVAGQVLAGPWYWRALLEHGNPIFPIRLSLGPLQLPGMFDPNINSAMMEQNTGRTGWAAWIHTLLEWPRPAALSSWTGGLGATVALLALPLAILALGHAIRILRGHSEGLDLRFTPPTVLFFCGLLVALAIPSAGVARFLLFPAATLFFLLPATLQVLPRAMALVILLGVGFGLLQDVGRIMAAQFYQQRDPAVLPVLGQPGGQGAAREDRWPGDISILTLLRDDVLTNTNAVLASRDLKPWLVQPALPRGRWFRRLAPSPPGETPTEFLQRVQGSNATVLHVRFGTPEWELARQVLPARAQLADLQPISSSYRHGPPDAERHALWRLDTASPAREQP